MNKQTRSLKQGTPLLQCSKRTALPMNKVMNMMTLLLNSDHHRLRGSSCITLPDLSKSLTSKLSTYNTKLTSLLNLNFKIGNTVNA